VSSLQPGNDALERRAVFAHAAVTVAVLHDHVVAETVHDDLLLACRQLGPRSVGVDSLLFGHRLEHPGEVHRVGASPRGDGTFGDAEIRIGHDELGIHLERGAEAEALVARAVRGVEREVTRRQFFV